MMIVYTNKNKTDFLSLSRGQYNYNLDDFNSINADGGRRRLTAHGERLRSDMEKQPDILLFIHPVRA